jgi:predicted RND superfamily exporter protein
MIETFYRFSFRWRATVLTVLAALTLFMAFCARSVRLESSTTDLFPAAHPYVEIFHKYSGRFGNANRVVIMLAVERGTIFNQGTLRKIQGIHRAVELLPGVNKSQLLSIASRKARTATARMGQLSSAFVMWPNVPSDERGVRAVRAAVASNQFLLGTLVSLDEKAALIIAEFFDHDHDPKRVYDDIQRIVARERDANTSIYVIGRPALIGSVLERSPVLVAIMATTWLFMLLALWLYFRSLAGVLVPAAAASVSGVMGFGFLGLLGQSFDPLGMVIPFVITARALSHSAQVVIRFLDERAAGRDRADAAHRSAVALFRPGSLAIVTDIAGVLFIYLAPIPLLQKLALMGAFWLCSIFLSGMVLSPLLLSLLPEASAVAPRGAAAVHRVLDGLGRLCTGPSRRRVFVAALGVLLLGALFARQVVIGDVHPGTALLWPSSPYNVAADAIAKRFTNTEQLTVVVEGASPEALRSAHVITAIEALQDHMEELPEVGATSSIVDVLPAVVALFHGEDPKWELIPTKDEDVGFFLQLLYTSGDPGDRDRFVTNDLKNASITLYLRDHRGDTLRKVIAHARRFIDSHPLPGARFRLAGGYGGLLAAINEDVMRFDARITLAAFASVFLCCALAFRSLTAGLLFLLPLVGSNLMTYALMGALGIGLDVNALPVVALGVGLGVDYGIYVVEAVREAFQRGGSVDDAVRQGLSAAGKAVLVTGLTMACGLAFWRFSFLRFQAEMGMLLLFWMLLSMLGALVLLPAILTQLRPGFLFGPHVREEPRPVLADG